VLLATLALPGRARADREQRARQIYTEGEKAYQANDYQKAYDDFKQAYILSQQPALLYDVASALQGLGRPHEAAEALRTYLKQVPSDPDRPAIEKRIAGLEDAQRLLDAEKSRPPATPAVAPAVPPAALAPTVPAAALSAAVSKVEAREKRKRTIAIVATVVSVALAGAAVGLAVGLTQHSVEPPTKSDLGPVMSTP
jgi:tetratricopeptide (TPR) repeat protein